MLYGIFADTVVFAHFLWILFLITGAFWGVKHQPVMMVHVAGLIFAIVSQVFGWYCPLTYLEVWLREMQQVSQAYPGSFIAHYVEKLVYIDMPPAAIFLLTLALAGLNVCVYSRACKKAGEKVR
jgi:hypothetical protein